MKPKEVNNIPCIINQPWALGDILFCISLARHLQKIGYKILWPTDYCFFFHKYFKDLTFIKENLIKINYEDRKFTINDDLIIIPLRFSKEIMGSLNGMRSKYDLLELPLSLWKKDMSWNRNIEIENTLYYDILKLKSGESYNLINSLFHPEGKSNINININNGLRNIDLQIIPKISLLDWYKVIQNATTIHTVSTSINYMMEIIDLKAEELHLYVRKPYELNFINTIDIFEKKYIYHL